MSGLMPTLKEMRDRIREEEETLAKFKQQKKPEALIRSREGPLLRYKKRFQERVNAAKELGILDALLKE